MGPKNIKNPSSEGENVTSEEEAVSHLSAGERVFRGVFSHAVDEKGRISLPSEFRRVLGSDDKNTIVVTNFISDGARCLDGFSLSAWRRFERKLAERSRFNPQVRKVENFYVARASLCELDGSGRILIPAYLRSYAGLEKEVTFTSSSHGFRLWDRRVWELVFQEAESALLEDPSLFSDVDV